MTKVAASRSGPGGLARRVLVVLALVVLTGNFTAWLVARAVAPPVFERHMHQAGESMTSPVAHHAEEAFQAASSLSLTAALLAALGVSVAVGLYVTRRLVRSLQPIVHAAADVAGGRYHVRLEPPGLGAEFTELTDAFNQMAGRLHHVEDTRRRLLADLAHEVRTPVATLGAYLEALEDGVKVIDPQMIGMMQAQVARLARLAEDVADVSRAEEGRHTLKRSRVRPVDLVAAAVAAASGRYATKGVRLTCSAPSHLPALCVDQDRLAQVLGNLLDNALRYTPPGGTVSVAAGAEGDGRVRLSVTDSGQGIGAEHLPHVFERFYRADGARDRAHGGSGIGLAIAKALVEAHGGSITAASAGRGSGARFFITLPSADDAFLTSRDGGAAVASVMR